VPYVDFLLFQDSEKSRAIQNIGGISNVTVLPAGGSMEDILAFDTGPGNMVIDETVRIITHAQRSYDPNGAMASKGVPSSNLLRELLSHPFVRRLPPKTTGREEFGTHFARELVDKARKSGISEVDLIATVTAYTAECIYQNYKRFILPEYDISEILVSGGGIHNVKLMDLLKEKFSSVPVRSVEDFGLVSDTKEAVAFAVLANETVNGNPGNVPSATGAKYPVVLGKIIHPSAFPKG